MMKKGSLKIMIHLYIIIMPALFVIMPGCIKSGPPKTILVGTVTDQTGPLAPFGVECKWGFQRFEKDINKDGGIYVKEFDKKIPVEILYGDHSANEQKAVKEVENLVDKGVVIITGTTALSSFGGAICEKNKIALLGFTISPLEPFKQGFKYSFNTTSQNDFFAEWPFWVIEAAPNPKPTKIGMMDEKNLMGVDYVISFKALAKERGYEDYVIQSYQRFSNDFTAQIQGFQKENVDLVFAPMLGPDGLLFIKQMKELNFNPKAIIMLVAPAIRQQWLSLGKDADYVLTSNAFHWTLPYPGVKEFSEVYRNEHNGENPTEMAGCAYGTLQVFKDAVERAGSLDRKKIRDAIAATDNVMTIIGPIKFKENGTSYTITPMVQYINGIEIVVLPKDLAERQMIYPFPKWNERE